MGIQFDDTISYPTSFTKLYTLTETRDGGFVFGGEYTSNVYIYKYIGDTTINNLIYKRVYECSNSNDSSYIINSNLTYFGAIREKNKETISIKELPAGIYFV